MYAYASQIRIKHLISELDSRALFIVDCMNRKCINELHILEHTIQNTKNWLHGSFAIKTLNMPLGCRKLSSILSASDGFDRVCQYKRIFSITFTKHPWTNIRVYFSDQEQVFVLHCRARDCQDTTLGNFFFKERL